VGDPAKIAVRVKQDEIAGRLVAGFCHAGGRIKMENLLSQLDPVSGVFLYRDPQFLAG
jgi:hypothetical protein